MLFPFGVDDALDYLGPQPLREYLGSRSYLAACKRRYRHFRKVFRVREWTLATIQNGLLPDGTLAIDLRASSMVVKLEKRLRKYQRGQSLNDRENVLAQFRASIFRKAEGFEVGELDDDGRFKANVFGKHLEFAAYWDGLRALQAELGHDKAFADIVEVSAEIPAPPSGNPDTEDRMLQLTWCMAQVVRLRIASQRQLEIFFLMVYRRETTRSLVGRHGAYSRAVGRQMEPVRNGWIAAITAWREGNVGNLPAFRFDAYGRLFAWLIGEDDFVRQVSSDDLS